MAALKATPVRWAITAYLCTNIHKHTCADNKTQIFRQEPDLSSARGPICVSALVIAETLVAKTLLDNDLANLSLIIRTRWPLFAITVIGHGQNN